MKHNIVILCIFTYSSCLLQPFNVNCFFVLKQIYKNFIKQSMNCGINHINKYNFLLLFQKICTKLLHQNNIHNKFATTNFIPFDSN